MNTQEAEIIDDDSNPELMPVRSERQEVGKALEPSNIRVPTTAAQAKVDAVANLTMSAYEKASTLNLLESEVKALEEDFPDEAFLPGAAGKENLIYCQHSYLRERLNKVFRPGQWCIVPRNRWAEDFKTQAGKPASRVYVEAMLVIRGCFVAEAVGEMEYYPNNASQNYGDAVEGAKTAALRRCCKELGIGLQAWRKEWCEAWWSRKRGQNAPQSTGNRPATHQNPPEATNIPQNAPAPFPTPETRAKFVAEMKAGHGEPNEQAVTDYFQKAGAIMENEELRELPLRFVPATKGQLRAVASAIAAFQQGERAELAFKPHDEPESAPKAKPAPKKAINASVPSVTGIIAAVSIKEGESARGKWCRYGIKVGDVWYSSFDKTIGEAAKGNKGQEAEIQYAEGKLGNDVVDLLFNGVSVKDAA